VELWLESQRASNGSREATLVVQNALGRTRFKISEGLLEAESWYQKLDQEAREQYRRSGRELLQRLTTYLVSEKSTAQAEARATGYEYASIGRRCGLSCVEAVQAYLFFRNVLVESMLSVYETAAIYSSYAWGEMLRRINEFTDHVLLALLETYQVYQGNNR
jgi:urease accessory protein UreF